jgi:peptide/nickel transport system substrate-binding protein
VRARVGISVVAALLIAACGSGDEATTTTSAVPATPASTTPASSTRPDQAATTTTTRAITTTTAPPTEPPRRGGTAVVGERQEPETLNPLLDGSASVWRIGELHLAGISDVGPDGRRRPEVLRDLPTVANGGLALNDDGSMTVRYEILPEAVWADGTPISGADFAFTYETLVDLEGYVPRYGADADLYRWILPDSIVVEDKVFEFTMRSATVQHELLFDVLLPRHQLLGTDVIADWRTTPWVSGGPFRLETWEPGTAMRFVRNEAYWRSDGNGLRLPYLDAVEIRFVSDAVPLVDAFRVADVEVIVAPGAVSVVDALAELTPSGVAVYTLPGSVWEHIAFQFGERNRNPGSLNGDVRFRRAVAHAIDREALVTELLAGYGRPLESYVDAYRPEASTYAWARYRYDPAEARRLVDEVCADRGLPCDIDPPVVVLSTTAGPDTRTRLVDELATMLAEAGVAVTLELEDSALLFGETLLAGTWDVGVWGWEAGPGLAPLVRAHDLWDAEGVPPFGTNYQRWGTPAVTDAEPVATSSGVVDLNQGESRVIDDSTARFGTLRDRMQGIVDEQALLALVADAEALLADQVVFVPLFARLWVGAVWADRVGGYVPNPLLDTWNVEQWHRLDLPKGAEEAGTAPGEE